jgi:hypothetical protein
LPSNPGMQTQANSFCSLWKKHWACLWQSVFSPFTSHGLVHSSTATAPSFAVDVFGGHSSHEVFCDSDWYVPFGHLTHWLPRLEFRYVPA